MEAILASFTSLCVTFIKKLQALTALKGTEDITILSVHECLETAICTILPGSDSLLSGDLVITVLSFITLKSNKITLNHGFEHI